MLETHFPATMPSRPEVNAKPPGQQYQLSVLTAQPVDCSRTDYAINERFIKQNRCGPATYASVCILICMEGDVRSTGSVRQLERGSTSFKWYSDGFRNLLLGREAGGGGGVKPPWLRKGSDPGHDQSPYHASTLDNTRWVTPGPRIDDHRESA